MQTLNHFLLFTSLFLCCLSCDQPRSEGQPDTDSNTTATATQYTEELELYFNGSNSTLNLYSEDLMRTLKKTTEESPQYAPFMNVALEADAILTETENLVIDIYSELTNSNSKSIVKEVMITDKAAENLVSNLQDAKQNLIDGLSSLNIGEQELMKFSHSLPILNGNLWADSDQPAQFEGLSLYAAKHKLLKIQHNVIQTRAIYYRFLNEKMSKKELAYDKFDVIANSEKDFVLLGETYSSEISLGAYSSQAKFSVSVNGRSLAIKDGKAIYNTRPSRVGEQKYSARISVSNPLTGETETFTKDFYFEVGQPSISVTADNMNILVIGEDNPVTIAAAGISSNNIGVSILGAGSSIKKIGKTSYMVKVTKAGKVTIQVQNKQNGNTFPFEFIAK